MVLDGKEVAIWDSMSEEKVEIAGKAAYAG